MGAFALKLNAACEPYKLHEHQKQVRAVAVVFPEKLKLNCCGKFNEQHVHLYHNHLKASALVTAGLVELKLNRNTY